MADSNKESKAWMQEARSAGFAAFVDRFPGEPLMAGPIIFKAVYFFKRPKNHYGSGKHADVLKASSPRIHSQSPDLAKLTRCIEDAFTGVVWVDDRQVFRHETERRWAEAREPERVEVEIMEVGV
jgi:Holliday junction resolvase RusA-like endonuclease